MHQPDTILILDSTREVSAVMADILRDEGYTVCSAHDRMATLALIAKRRLALVLLDAHQPYLTRAAVCDAMRRYGVDAPVVLTTTKPQPAAMYTAEGRSLCLIKPFTIDELLACVAAHVDPCARLAATT